MSDKPPVLVVLDDQEQRDFLLRALKVNGYPAAVAKDGPGALSQHYLGRD